MKLKDIEARLKKLLSEELDIPLKKLRSNSHLTDELGIDSFGKVELAYAIENAFSIRILENTSKLPPFITVKDMVVFIGSVINGKKNKSN